jgi:hypothetical protein
MDGFGFRPHRQFDPPAYPAYRGVELVPGIIGTWAAHAMSSCLSSLPVKYPLRVMREYATFRP